ncbi:hypothetical protein BRADI_1g58521v3 [Brachypodium distachyon]|uniref:Uncharacterized protein n=2 Tax=Brachypodium distachyon TaxID=15368 RepID=A0A2K2DSA7_BRADI|nr:hypothetical protein BRADI_1g58521v3 [Brachypodium distachyon]
MHEYAVTSPAALASSPMRAYRIKFSGHGKKRKRGDSCGGAGDEEDEDDRGLAAWQRPISGSVFPDQDSSSLLQAASSDDDQPPPPLDSFQGLGSSSYDAAGRPMIAAASDQDGAPAENVVNFEAFWNFELADLENVSLDGFLNFDQQHTVLD